LNKRDPQIVCVRFYQSDGFSRKRYCYFTNEFFDAGEHVIVDVTGIHRTVMVVANEESFWPGEPGPVTSSEKQRAYKHVLRKATNYEKFRAKKDNQL